MAFGYEYWMVYLPEFNPDTFLLFDHNPDGGTNLRDYSGGRAYKVGQPSVRRVREATEWGSTRFQEEPHRVDGPAGEDYWRSRTAEYNSRYLASVQAVLRSRDVLGRPAAPPIAMNGPGRAKRGSKRQLQDYVNLKQSVLDAAILSALPAKIQQSSPQISWLSPLAAEQFREYRDAEFLSVLGLGQYSGELRKFWPERGPCWDGLAVLRTALPGSLPIALLVEAKSHVPEVYGDGCQAGETSRALIDKSMAAAKKWCGATIEADWAGSLYQSANRIAHLYFLRQCLNRPCFLVNVHFIDDQYRPTSHEEWLSGLNTIHMGLGLAHAVPGLLELFLPACAPHSEPNTFIHVMQSDPALAQEVDVASAVNCAPSPPLCGVLPARPPDEELSFAAWCSHWNMLGMFQGPTVPDSEARIRRLSELWEQEIPGRWQRGLDPQLLGSRYRRGDLHTPHPGEHAIEHRILVERFGEVTVLGGKLIDGVNAFPLACDFAGGRRCGNVEADMLLAVRSGETLRLLLCEVKAGANDCWYAAIESLRQMRLFLTNPVGRAVMQQRGAMPETPKEVPVTGLVLAPVGYYRAPGKKANAVEPAKRLFALMRERFGVDMRLAVWDGDLTTIREL